MFRLVATLLAVFLVAPTAAMAGVANGIEAVGPDHCCCKMDAPSDESAQIPQSEFRKPCCCELHEPTPDVAAKSATLSSRHAVDLAAPEAVRFDAQRALVGHPHPPIPPARGPPPAGLSLLAQHTSHVI